MSASGILGLLSMLVFGRNEPGMSDQIIPLLFLALGGVLFGYVAVTGNRNFYFLQDFAKRSVRKKMLTETGLPRWN